MPRNGELSNEEKARAVLCRTGRPGNQVAGLEPAEQDELAAVYDECIAPELLLKQRIGEFWGRRAERLAAAKAADSDTDAEVDRFRNRPGAPAATSSQAAPQSTAPESTPDIAEAAPEPSPAVSGDQPSEPAPPEAAAGG